MSIPTTHQTMESRTLVLQWLPSQALLLCREAKEISLVPRNNNYQAIKTCSKIHLVDMHIRFINSSFFSKCRNSLCIISIQEVPMDQGRVMETMLKVLITNMEILFTVAIKILAVLAMSSCLKVKRSFMPLHQERRQNKL